MSLAAIASIAAPILSSLGKGKGTGPTQVSGYASQPGEVKDYMMSVLLPMIKQLGAQKYKGLPKRRVNAADMDPIFGNPTLPGLQEMADQAYTGSNASSLASIAAPDTSMQQAEMNWNRMHPAGVGGLRNGVSFADFYNSISPQNRAKIFGLGGQ